jgi:ABC-type phosphate transport system substrate-binding protein
MRVASKLLLGCAALALVVASAGPVLADPPGGITPRGSDVVGVGSDTIGYLLDQFSHDYNKSHPKATSLLYSWDATNPVSGKAGDLIATKAGCKAIARPDGSLAGIKALKADVFDPAARRDHCVDYAGSSTGPSGTRRRCSVGHICYVPLAIDAVTWASRDAASGGTDAPRSLTLAQLSGIYDCTITNWSKVGGRSGHIKPFLPQTSSGTRTFWLAALGLTTPGTCVSDEGNTLADNQGISPALDSAGAIVPYSVADYLAQVYRDARCAHSSCTGSPACKPTAAENLFGCDTHGVLGINEVDGSKPTLPWPLPKSRCKPCTINPKFTPVLQRLVYVAVRGASTSDHIPAYLEPLFGPKGGKKPGWCSKPQAQSDIVAYGFLTLGGSAVWSDAVWGDNPNARPSCGTPYY